MKIESSDTDIETLFQANFLVVPRFQRPYSWDAENIYDFWEDIIQNDDPDYFIGSMVVFQAKRQHLGIVDGQQRLTTITLLLCAVRDRLEGIGETDLAKGLHQFVERMNRDNVETFVLKTETSYPYFQDQIQKMGEPDLSLDPSQEEMRLKSAYEFFDEQLRTIIKQIETNPLIADHERDERKKERLIGLRDKVLQLKIILVELDNEDDAYLIFETLNTRGKDLALSDLVKNHFTRQIKEGGDLDIVREKWATILQELQRFDLDPDLFITHSWASRYEPVTQKKAFKSIKAKVNRKDAKTQLNFFQYDSRYYTSIYDDTAWGKPERPIRDSLRALRTFRVTQQTPAVLALIRAFRANKIKTGKLAKALQAIEHFHFVFQAVTSSRSSGGISAMYTSFGRRLYEAGDSNAASQEINELVKKLRDRRPSESEFVASFEQIGFTNVNPKQSALVRYILRGLSRHEDLRFEVDTDELTIEHIHPQSSLVAPWSEESVGMMGNLILLSAKRNEELKNKPAVEKLKTITDWKCVPQWVRSSETWTPELVQARTQEMARTAFNDVWKI